MSLAKKAQAYTFSAYLESASTDNSFQSNPTLATGDVKVIKDGGAAANIATLPTVTPAGGTRVQVALSASEMDADLVDVIFLDAAGGEWFTVTYTIETYTEIDANIVQVSGDSTAADNLEADYDGTGYNKSNSTIGTTTTNTDMRGTDSAATASALATVDANVDAILIDTAEIGAAGAGLTALATQSSVDTIDGIVGDILVDTGATIPAQISALNDITAADVLAVTIENSLDLADCIRLQNSALLAKVSGGATTTNTFRDLADSKNRITATVDADGNRTAITLDGS